MNWVVLVWTMMAASSLTLAAVHLFVWFRQRADHAHLLFFLLAVSAAAFGAFELLLMRAETPEAYATVLRWAHVPLCAFVLSVVGFVYFYLDARHTGLAVSICALRLLTLVLDFTTGVNVNFREVTALRPLELFGETVATPVGVANPWTIVPQLSNLLLIYYVMAAAIALWRRGGHLARRRAVVGTSIIAGLGFASVFAGLVIAGVVRAPTIVMPSVFIIVLAMGYDLVVDVVAAAQLSAQLRASEARFRAVVQSVPHAILLVGESGTIAFANPQARDVFGYTPDELLGKRVEALVPAVARDGYEAHRRAYLLDAQPRAMGAGRELFGVRKDGSEVPVEVGLSPLHLDDEWYLLASIVDVGERRRIEQAAAHQRNEVAHLSRVGMLGALSGSLAHELNQPLTAILSNAQAAQRFLAQSPPRLDFVAEIIDDIVKSDRRAAAVIQRLRALLRKEDTEHRPVDINEVVQDSVRLMHSDLLSRRVDVAVQLDPSLPAISADRVQLQQVLLNFVMNGCEAMERMSDARSLAVCTRRTESGEVEVTVSDSGPGIAPADLSTIFEPFVTTKRHGTGLGLAICRTIVDAHAGHIWATNNPEGGATLHFTIPASEKAIRDGSFRDRVRG